MPAFMAYPAMSVLRKEDFDGTAEISEAFARHVVSPEFPRERFPVRCTAHSEPVGTGVRLSFTSTIANLDRDTTVVHRFFFVDREETRERIHRLTADRPAATSEILVLFGTDRGQQKDYCHASVYDNGNYLLANHSLVFNNRGALISYPFTQRYVSPLRLGLAYLTETCDARGRRVLRFRVSLADLAAPQRLHVAWQAIGAARRDTVECTPEHPEATSDLALDDNPHLAPADWSLIAVDDKDRLLAQTIVTVAARGPGGRPAGRAGR